MAVISARVARINYHVQLLIDRLNAERFDDPDPPSQSSTTVALLDPDFIPRIHQADDPQTR